MFGSKVSIILLNWIKLFAFLFPLLYLYIKTSTSFCIFSCPQKYSLNPLRAFLRVDSPRSLVLHLKFSWVMTNNRGFRYKSLWSRLNNVYGAQSKWYFAIVITNKNNDQLRFDSTKIIFHFWEPLNYLVWHNEKTKKSYLIVSIYSMLNLAKQTDKNAVHPTKSMAFWRLRRWYNNELSNLKVIFLNIVFCWSILFHFHCTEYLTFIDINALDNNQGRRQSSQWRRNNPKTLNLKKQYHSNNRESSNIRQTHENFHFYIHTRG